MGAGLVDGGGDGGANATANNAADTSTAATLRKKGKGAWNSLNKWYAGDKLREHDAEEKRNMLENLRLHANTTASSYLNLFLTSNRDLSIIPEESYT